MMSRSRIGWSPSAVRAAFQGELEHGVIDPLRQLVEGMADAHEQARPDQLEDGLKGIQADQKSARPIRVGTLLLGSTRS